MSKGKILALLIAVGYVWWLLSSKTQVLGKAPAINCTMAAIATVMIWFPDTLGNMTGIHGSLPGRTNQTSPGCAVAVLGWVLLLGFPVVMYVVFQGL